MTPAPGTGVCERKAGSPGPQAEKPGGNQAARGGIWNQRSAAAWFLPESRFGAEHPAAAIKEAALGQRWSKGGQPACPGGIGWSGAQRGCTRCMRFGGGAIQRAEDRGAAGFRFGHIRTTA